MLLILKISIRKQINKKNKNKLKILIKNKIKFLLKKKSIKV